MSVKTVSTQQAKQTLDNTHFLTVSDVGPVIIFDIEGEVSGTTATSYFIQLIGVPVGSAVSGTTIPLFSQLVDASQNATGKYAFGFHYRPLGLDTSMLTNPVGGTLATGGSNTLPVYVAVSSTDNVWTAVNAATEVTVTFEDQNGLEIPNQTITGDTTTGVDALTVFADPNAAKKLVAIEYSNSDATANAPVYLQLFASSPVANQIPLQEWTVKQTALTYLNLGSGFAVQGLGAPTIAAGVITVANYTLHTGCYLAGSSTAGYFTATAATHWTLKAWNV